MMSHETKYQSFNMQNNRFKIYNFRWWDVVKNRRTWCPQKLILRQKQNLNFKMSKIRWNSSLARLRSDVYRARSLNVSYLFHWERTPATIIEYKKCNKKLQDIMQIIKNLVASLWILRNIRVEDRKIALFWKVLHAAGRWL